MNKELKIIEQIELNTLKKEEIEKYKKEIENIEIPPIEEIPEKRKELNEIHKKLQEKRKNFYLKIEEEKKIIMSLEKTIKLKSDEFKKITDEIEAKEIEKRIKKGKEYFELFKGDIFDFITFEDLNINKIKNKTSFTANGVLTKSVKEEIEEKIKNFNKDKLLLKNDLVAINFYKENNFNSEKAIEFSKKIKEEKQEKIKNDIEKIREIEKMEQFEDSKEKKQKVIITIEHDSDKINGLIKFIQKNLFSVLDEKKIKYQIKKGENNDK